MLSLFFFINTNKIAARLPEWCLAAILFFLYAPACHRRALLSYQRFTTSLYRPS